MFSIYVTEGEQIYGKQVWSKWGALWDSKLMRVGVCVIYQCGLTVFYL